MFDLTFLAIAWGLTILLTLTVVAILRAPLYAVLQYICGTDIGARFWTTYSSVMIVIGPLFLVSITSFAQASLSDFLRSVMVRLSLGLIGAVVIMGLAVNSAANAKRRGDAPPLPRAPE
jgi:hypothetical protein